MKTTRLNCLQWLNLLGWALCVCVVAVITVPIHDWVGGQQMELFGRALYSALSRLCWSFLVGWVVFACFYGSGGPVDRLLRWPGWVPLGRLSYCAYLVHLMVVVWLLTFFERKFIFQNVLQTVSGGGFECGVTVAPGFGDTVAPGSMVTVYRCSAWFYSDVLR